MSAASATAAFGDRLGPRGRRRVVVATALAGALLAWALVVAFRRFESRGQLRGELWTGFFSGEAQRFLLAGLTTTLRAAAAAAAFALALAGLLALLRLSRRSVVRRAATVWIELFRGVPLVLLIIYCAFGLPKLGLDIERFWALVLGLVLYNSAILAEILRAGILSIDRGQREAALAVGLTEGGAMRSVVLPQAIRRMVPALISQVVVLLKDTSLGVAIALEELLRRAQIAGTFLKADLQAYVIVAAVYFVVNFALSSLARAIERRQGRGRSRSAGTGPVTVAGVEDLTAGT